MNKTIKHVGTLLSIWLLSVNFHPSESPLKRTKDPELCLEIDGKIAFDQSGLDESCYIVLYRYNQIVDSFQFTSKTKKFKFALKKNLDYTIEIRKKGYYTRLIAVSTALPDKTKDHKKMYKYRFYTKLLSEERSTKLNDDAVDFPIAIIKYNSRINQFLNDKRYTKEIKKLMMNNKGF
ncbi:MAG: hypothetical protein V4677_16425 [Bacteroidota bacterium]